MDNPVFGTGGELTDLLGWLPEAEEPLPLSHPPPTHPILVLPPFAYSPLSRQSEGCWLTAYCFQTIQSEVPPLHGWVIPSSRPKQRKGGVLKRLASPSFSRQRRLSLGGSLQCLPPIFCGKPYLTSNSNPSSGPSLFHLVQSSLQTKC